MALAASGVGCACSCVGVRERAGAAELNFSPPIDIWPEMG